MSYKGNQVAWDNFSPSLQDKLKNSGGSIDVKQYILETTQINQKSWNIPANTMDTAKGDTILVFHNTVNLKPTSWNLTGDAGSGYVLNIPENPFSEIANNNVSIVIFRSLSEAPNSEFSGTNLTPSSVGLDKLGQDVRDKIGNTNIEIVNDLVTGGATKVASAETVKTLNTNLTTTNTNVGNKVDKTSVINNFTTGGATNVASAETVKLLKQSVDSVTSKVEDNSVTYYVNGISGSDTNSGLSSGTAFKTIQKAVDMLALKPIGTKKRQINIEPNQVYNESVKVSGLHGEEINITGYASSGVKPTLKGITIENCTAYIRVLHIDFKPNGAITVPDSYAVFVTNCTSVMLYNMEIVKSAISIRIERSNVDVDTCTISESSGSAIDAFYRSYVYINSVKGSNPSTNCFGIYSASSIVIGNKSGTNPLTGGRGDGKSSGGQIFI